MLHSQKKGGKKKKKPQGAASQGKKPASFIKSPTFIKTSCGAGSYQPPPILPPPQKPFQTSLFGTPPQSGVRLPPRGPLPSENSVRSQIQLEAPSSLHPPPHPSFSFPPSPGRGSYVPRFLQNRRQPDALRDGGDWVSAFHNLKLARPA